MQSHRLDVSELERQNRDAAYERDMVSEENVTLKLRITELEDELCEER